MIAVTAIVAARASLYSRGTGRCKYMENVICKTVNFAETLFIMRLCRDTSQRYHAKQCMQIFTLCLEEVT